MTGVDRKEKEEGDVAATSGSSSDGGTCSGAVVTTVESSHGPSSSSGGGGDGTEEIVILPPPKPPRLVVSATTTSKEFLKQTYAKTESNLQKGVVRMQQNLRLRGDNNNNSNNNSCGSRKGDRGEESKTFATIIGKPRATLKLLENQVKKNTSLSEGTRSDDNAGHNKDDINNRDDYDDDDGDDA